nr:DUF5412 family protein [Bacillus mesophilus]
MVLCVNIIISLLKKKSFSRKLLIVTIVGAILVTIIFIYTQYFFTFNSIDRESFQRGPGPIKSPTDRYSANAYYELYGGAAGGVNVWVEITDHNNNNERKTIYYSDVNTQFNMKWTDKNTLFIKNEEPEYPESNKTISLNVETEIYHEWGLACQSLLMINQYKTCYQGSGLSIK